MSDNRVERRYCAVIQLRDAGMQRLKESMPLIKEMLEGWSLDYAPLCASTDGSLTAFFIKTKKPAGMLSAEFESCRGTRHGDTFIVFEVGEECSSSTGFQRPLAWLQHQKAK